MEYIALEKLKWRSRRSMLELDLLLERFILDGSFDLLDESELLAYQYLLTLEDNDLLVLFQGKATLADSYLQQLINKIVKIEFYAPASRWSELR